MLKKYLSEVQEGLTPDTWWPHQEFGSNKEAEEKLPGFGEKPPQLDLVFKVFKLDKSNFKVWAGPESDASEDEIAKQLELHIDHIHPNSSQEDILYELLMKAGFILAEKVETRKLAGKTVYSVSRQSFGELENDDWIAVMHYL